MSFGTIPARELDVSLSRGPKMIPTRLFYDTLDNNNPVPQTYSQLCLYYDDIAIRSLPEWKSERIVAVGVLKNTNRIVFAIPSDGSAAMIDLVASPFSYDSANFRGKDVGLAHEAGMTDVHGLQGFVPTAQIIDWGIVRFFAAFDGNDRQAIFQKIVGVVGRLVKGEEKYDKIDPLAGF